MRFLESGFRPVATKNVTTYSDVVAQSIAEASRIQIVTGYFGTESIVEFQEILERNPRPREIKFIVGMAIFDGLTQIQLNALEKFAKYLIDSSQGNVYVSEAFPIHSKVAVFTNFEKVTSGVIGSSNFTNLVSTSRQYETDLLVTQNDEVLSDLEEFVERAQRACSPISECKGKIRVLSPKLAALSVEDGVEKSTDTTSSLNKSPISFEIPIKPEAQSHLNTFFGKGRVNSKGFVMPRPWYEAEIIVSNSITKMPGYPSKTSSTDEFTVLTDDGWLFNCKVTGDNGKNFRSSGNLEILGKWLKGRLEESGALIPGQPVTRETLEAYGRNSMTFTKLMGRDNYWLLDFSKQEWV